MELLAERPPSERKKPLSTVQTEEEPALAPAIVPQETVLPASGTTQTEKVPTQREVSTQREEVSMQEEPPQLQSPPASPPSTTAASEPAISSASMTAPQPELSRAAKKQGEQERPSPAIQFDIRELLISFCTLSSCLPTPFPLSFFIGCNLFLLKREVSTNSMPWLSTRSRRSFLHL